MLGLKRWSHGLGRTHTVITATTTSAYAQVVGGELTVFGGRGGGGLEFTRPWVEEVCGILPEQVVVGRSNTVPQTIDALGAGRVENLAAARTLHTGSVGAGIARQYWTLVPRNPAGRPSLGRSVRTASSPTIGSIKHWTKVPYTSLPPRCTMITNQKPQRPYK